MGIKAGGDRGDVCEVFGFFDARELVAAGGLHEGVAGAGSGRADHVAGVAA